MSSAHTAQDGMSHTHAARSGPWVTVGGLPVLIETAAGLAERMVADCRTNRRSGWRMRPSVLVGANGQTVSLYGSKPDYRVLIDQVDAIYADGMSLVTASRLLARRSLPERIATTDFVHDAARRAAAEGIRFLLLGGQDGVAAAAAQRLVARHPGLQVVGCLDGYFTAADEAALLDAIRAARPDVLWVGLGSPRQEAFCLRHREALTGVTWIMTCGGLFDFLAGRASRAPQLMQQYGLEWLYRLAREPRRLAWRYLTTNPHAALRMLFATSDGSPEGPGGDRRKPARTAAGNRTQTAQRANQAGSRRTLDAR